MTDYEENYYRVFAKIDLDAICDNMRAMRKNIGPDSKICAIVKTDGYGHGAVPIARAVEEQVDFCAVATAEEAISLRRGGIQKPILILGYTHPSTYPRLIRRNVRITIFKEEDAMALSLAAQKLNMTAKMHFKVDTGMGRIGFPVNEENANVMARIAKLPCLEAEGMFTHFARADEADKRDATRQHEKFEQMIRMMQERGVQIPIIHCDNSAGLIDLPQWHHSMVRAGIAIYGLYPSEEVVKENVPLKPALSLYSHVVYVKEIHAGDPVSYGGTYVAKETRRIATIPVGYGDGYPRALSNQGWVLIRGKKAPIVGRVCMDQMMVDITDIPEASDGDLVTLIGCAGEESITADEIAAMCGTIHYEIICNFTKRIPRLFFEGGVFVEEIPIL